VEIIDISWPLTMDMTGYKDRVSVVIESLKSMEKDSVRETKIMIHSHAGTHVDAPAHFLAEGKAIDQISLESLVGLCQVIDVTDIEEKITEKELEKEKIDQGDIILFKTKNSYLSATEKFNTSFIYLSDTAADYLIDKKVKAVGIDYLGIERSQIGHPTHRQLLHANITIIEGLRLSHVSAGIYFFVCLPLSIIGNDAAPARAILILQ
jgi:arylformamidase